MKNWEMSSLGNAELTVQGIGILFHPAQEFQLAAGRKKTGFNRVSGQFAQMLQRQLKFTMRQQIFFAQAAAEDRRIVGVQRHH